MSTEAAELAERLLDAQVAFVVAELSGPEAAAVVAAEVREVLAALDDVPLADLVTSTALAETLGVALDTIGGSPAIGAMVSTLVPLVHDLPANEEHDLGDVVMWGGVEAIVDVLARSEQLHEEVRRRLGESPAVQTLALRFVTALVGDAVQQNRERAEKVPGMKSVLGVGDLAARTARGMAPKQLERMVGGAADKGTQAAMERVSRALVDAFDEDVVREAFMELWDLHAEDTIAGLRAYLPREDLEHVAANAHVLWLDAHPSPWARTIVEAAVEAFFERYGGIPLGEVLADFGLDPDVVATEVERHAPRILAALHASGQLEALVRRRLAPFYASDAALEVLDEAGGRP